MADEFRSCAEQRQFQMEQSHRILELAASLVPGGTVPVPHILGSSLVLRSLLPSEIDALQQSHCRCTEWSRVCLLLDSTSLSADQSPQLREWVSQNGFDGSVVLDLSSPSHDNTRKKKGVSFCCGIPNGIRSNLRIANSILSIHACVQGNSVVCDTHACAGSVLLANGQISGSPPIKDPAQDCFVANGGSLSLSVGAESGGGRFLQVTPEFTMMDVGQQLAGRGGDSTTTTAIRRLSLSSLSSSSISSSSSSFSDDEGRQHINLTIVSQDCVIRDTPTIQGVYLAPGSSIQAATSAKNAILYPTSTIRNGCLVDNVRLQWKAAITDNSTVSNTLLMEEAHIGPNSLVASSIMGPDVHVSTGEVHCSIMGPNTNAHHQSLVISVLWPLGRGNVGYGANIGSNHTGRLPDQETASGEGVFWGLSTVIKFPVDMTMAPYSIVAAGTTVPPQRVAMPFSLIVASSGDYNTIMPGWVLSASPYTLARSEKKFATRRKAKRHKEYTGWKIIRPETIQMCHWARKELMSAKSSPTGVYDTDRAVKGIGSNCLSEKDRKFGILAYSKCIQRFALEGLLAWLIKESKRGLLSEQTLTSEFQGVAACVTIDVTSVYDKVQWPPFPWESNGCSLWEYQKHLLVEEFPGSADMVPWVEGLLLKLIVLEKEYAKSIYKSKSRDDKRGANTIPGYADSHTAAESDPVIIETRRTADKIETTATALLGELNCQGFRSKL